MYVLHRWSTKFDGGRRTSNCCHSYYYWRSHILQIISYYIICTINTYNTKFKHFFFIRSSWVCMSCACLLLFIGCFCSICTPAIALVIIESRVKSLWRAEQLSVVESCKTLITLRFTIRAIIMCFVCVYLCMQCIHTL